MRHAWWMVGLTAALLLACQDSEPEVTSSADTKEAPDSESGEVRTFVGTSIERSVAMADCYRDMGFTVRGDPSDPTTDVSIYPGLVDDEEFSQAARECRERVGEWVLPDGYLEQLYEHAAWQRECLIDLGHNLDDPPSFDVFAEERDWDPLGEAAESAGLRGAEFLSLEDQCPHFHQWEAQQEAGE